MQYRIPTAVLFVVSQLEKHNFEAYLVGGCTRDMLRDATPKDWDITTNATPEQIQDIFPDSFYENDFGTVGVKTGDEDPTLAVVEVTPYRIESTYSNARHPDSVTFSQHIEDDLKRRDFTINAIAYSPTTHTTVDPYNGTEDIRLKRLVAVGDAQKRFEEDALRMLRAIRLSAELSFTIDPTTAEAIANNAQLLEKISHERIRDEFSRIIASPTPMQAIFFAERFGLLAYIIPEILEGVGCTQNQAHSFDVYEHLLRSLQHAADKNYPFEVRLSALLHDIGKPASRRIDDRTGEPTFYGHEVIGARITKRILERLKYPKETTRIVVNLVRWHMFFSDPDQITLSAVRRMIRNVGEEHIDDLLDLRICDRIGTGRPKEQPFRFRKYKAMVDEARRDPISVGMLKINGEDVIHILGTGPGPRVGWILHALLEEVLDDPQKNTQENLTTRAQELAQLADSDLRILGEHGKDRREEEDTKQVQALHKKHHVA